MRRVRALKIAVGLMASLAFTSLAVLSSPLHEGDDEAPSEPRSNGGPGPRAEHVVPMPTTLTGLEITFGRKDENPSDWSGEIRVSEGRVLGLEVVRAAGKAESRGASYTVKSLRKGAAKKKKAQNKKKQQGQVQGAILRANLDAPPSAKVTITTGKGEVSFALEDIKSDSPSLFLDGQIGVVRQTATTRLTGDATEDDFPDALKGPDGSVWMVYVEYKPETPRLNQAPSRDEFDKVLVPTTNGDQIRLRRYDGKAWQPAIDVTKGGLDVWRPQLALDGKGTLWVLWAQQVDGNWDIYRRGYALDDGKWTETTRVTDDPGTDFHVVAATDADGNVWIAWQAWRSDDYDILAAPMLDAKTQAKSISNSDANDWSPAIAADSKNGGVYVAWDTYDRNQYDVRLRRVDQDSSPQAVAGSSRFEGRPNLTFDAKGRLWIAYEEGDEQWGKDYANGTPQKVPVESSGFALYINRTIRVKCWDGDRLLQPAASVDKTLKDTLKRNTSLGRLAVDSAGGLWLLLRHHPLASGAGEVWVSSALHYDGTGWSSPQELIHTRNLMDNRPALVPLDDAALLVIHSTDYRERTQNREQDDLYATVLRPEREESQAPELVANDPPADAEVVAVHPNEPADKARIRQYRIKQGGKSLKLLRGEFHRHTEFTAHRDQDGLLEDSWRYAQDAVDHDWMGNGDHHNGFGHEYMWWIIQKVADIHNHGDRFVAAQSYERSAVYPNGHRNVILPRRGIRPLPFGDLKGTPEEGTPDTKLLYDYLKHFGGMTAVHTSATNMGTDWRDNDPEVEPVVEIYQGHRHNYEHFGAPRSPTEETQIGGYRPAGFIWNALEKGYRLGFQSSSDHVSTHWSYAVVLSEENSRQAIIDAFKKRHSYAATDNIILDVRSGDHLMGDEFSTTERPTIQIVAQGTTPITKLHVIRDNKYAFSTEPGTPKVELTYSDDDAQPGESHYYYIRVQQADDNLAWASPMWITYEKK